MNRRTFLGKVGGTMALAMVVPAVVMKREPRVIKGEDGRLYRQMRLPGPLKLGDPVHAGYGGFIGFAAEDIARGHYGWVCIAG